MKQRSGTALAELLIAAALLGLVAAAAATLLQAQARVVHMVTRETAFSEAARTTLLALRSDLAHLRPDTDVRAYARDSIAARIYRGFGIVCGQSAERVLVRYRGLRLPEPDKDSILELATERVTRVHSVARSELNCGSRAGEDMLQIQAGQSIAAGSVLLVFETGTYSLANNALRYQRGTEGRQPITAEEIDTRASSLSVQADSVMRAIRISVQSRSPWRRRLHERVRFSNALE